MHNLKLLHVWIEWINSWMNDWKFIWMNEAQDLQNRSKSNLPNNHDHIKINQLNCTEFDMSKFVC